MIRKLTILTLLLSLATVVGGYHSTFGQVVAQDHPSPAVTSLASPRKVIRLRAQSVNRLSVSVYPFGANAPRLMTGELNSDKFKQEPEKVQFAIYSNKNEKLWTSILPWKSDFITQTNRIRIPFTFNLPENDFGKIVYLHASVFGADKKLLAKGSSKVTLPMVEAAEAKAFMELSDLKVEKLGDQMQVTFGAYNPNEMGRYYGIVTVTPDTLDAQPVAVYETDPVAIDANGTETLTYSFPVPRNPQLYDVTLQMFPDGEDNPISGLSVARLLVKGAFAEVNQLNIEPMRYLRSGDPVKIRFRGGVSEIANSVNAKVTVTDALTGALLHTAVESLPVNNYLEFIGNQSFTLTQDVSQMKLTITFDQNGKTVGTYEHISENFDRPVGMVDQPETSSGFSFENLDQRTVLFGGGGLLLLILIIVVIAMKSKKRTTLVLIFGLLLSAQSQVSANFLYQNFADEVYTSAPMPGSPVPGLGEDFFRQIPFRGTAEGPSGGVLEADVSTLPRIYFLQPGTALPPGFDQYTIIDDLEADGTVTKLNGANFLPPADAEYYFPFDMLGPGVTTQFDTEGTYKLLGLKFSYTHTVNGPTDVEIVFADENTGAYTGLDFEIDKTSPVPTFTIKDNGGSTTLKNPDGGPGYDTFDDAMTTCVNNPPCTNQDKKNIVAEYFTNQSVDVELDCGGDCPEQGAQIYVKGNFCDDDTQCAEQGVTSGVTGSRYYKLCDDIGNCTEDGSGMGDQELVIKNFDGAAPTLDGYTLDVIGVSASRTVNSGQPTATTMKAFDQYLFQVDNALEGTTVSAATVDNHACGIIGGDDYADSFYEDTTIGSGSEYCHPMVRNCAVGPAMRGQMVFANSGGPIAPGSRTCNPQCDLGMVPDYCHPNDTQKLCCVPTCKLEFPYCFPFRLN